MADQVTLTIDGQVHAGWTGASVRLSVERCAATFDLTVTERWVGQTTRRSILPGQACTLSIGGEPVIAGFVDSADPDYDATSHSIKVSGRDRTGDMIDCAAAVTGPWEFGGLTLTEIAARLAGPFGVTVRSDVPAGEPFGKLATQPGETAWEVLERAARQRAVLVLADGLGGLVLTRAGLGGPAAGAIRLGGKDGNVLSARGSYSWADRFSLYVVRGQGEAPDVVGADQATGPEGRATDAGVTRYRPTVILAEAQGGGANFQERAAWAARVASGKARRASYEVPGWRGATGRLWRPNTLVSVVDEYLDLDRTLLVTAVELSLDQGGQVARVEVAPPDAFALIEEPAKGKGGGSAMEVGLYEVVGGKDKRIGGLP